MVTGPAAGSGRLPRGCSAPAGGRPVPQAPGVEVLLPHGRPGPPSYPPGGRQGAHAPPRDSSVSQATALLAAAQVDQSSPAVRARPARGTARAGEALEKAVIGKAVDLMSGPGGLASFLRRRQLGARLGGPSLPLDVGVSPDIPAAIRRAVILRDQHCRFPGGCDQPAAACEVHT